MNKITLMLAGLCLCGAAVAQGTTATTSVEGSNTGVVIKKTEVVSSNGYQMLVVPVKGYDIAGGQDSTKSVTLGEMLPPASNNGRSVLVLGVPENAQSGVTIANRRYTSNGTEWMYAGTTGGSDDTEGTDDAFPAGTIFWLSESGVTPPTDAIQTLAAGDTIVFCGTSNDAGLTLVGTSGQVVALGNSTSGSVTLGSLSGASLGDQIFRVQNGTTEYQIYQYVSTKSSGWKPQWHKLVVSGTQTSLQDASEEEIPAAEAFYFYTR